jgi:hypothetical protein
MLQLTTPRKGSENKIEDPLHFPYQSKKIALTMTLGTR